MTNEEAKAKLEELETYYTGCLNECVSFKKRLNASNVSKKTKHRLNIIYEARISEISCFLLAIKYDFN